MNFQILCIGKIKDGFYKRQIDGLCAGINAASHHIEITEFPDKRIPERMADKGREAFLEDECGRMMQRISPGDFVIALCIEGKELGTKQHREYIDKALRDGFDTITYVIGGSLGLPERIKRRANLKMSFSKMTFPHQMMRMVLCEEIAGIAGRKG